MKTKYSRAFGLLPALALMIAAAPSRAHATETTARVAASAAELTGDAAKASLQELDVEIDEVEAMIDNAPTPEEKAAAKTRLEALKDRRSELRKTYVKARYDELKNDVRAEANRVGHWTKSKFKKDPAEKAADEMKDAADKTADGMKRTGDSAYAYGRSAGATMDIAAYKLRPTDTNKEEAKAALKALDQKIDELDDRADAMPKGPDRDAAKRRVKALEDRKDELKHDFNKARFDALVDDVKSAWN